jgi:UDP-glucose 4-epimerase
MTKNILVTGGAGFIGSHVVRALQSQKEFADYRISVLDDLSGGFLANVPNDRRVEFIEGSITDNELVEELFQKKHFRYVYHLAAYAAEGLSHFIRRFNYMNNLIGSMNLINAAVNYESECFVFTSSIAVYGTKQVPMQEDMVPEPEDPYGISKYAVEMDLRTAHEMFGLDYIIFRPHNVYGECQNIGDRYRNVVGIFMNQILRGQPMTVFGNGKQKRAFSYIGDIAPVIAGAPLVKRGRNRIFNIGANQPYTVNELARKVAEAMGVRLDLIYLAPRREVTLAFSDHLICEETFGPLPQTSLEDGLYKMAAWVKGVGSRKSKEFKKIEITQRLPEPWVQTESL